MSKKTVLTGITTTGTPHIGNYLGAIKPAIQASEKSEFESYFFLADYHALIKCHDPQRVASSSREIAATWLAMGLDTQKATFYRQSDIPEITELSWILTCMTSKGLMNRSHAYKASVDANQQLGKAELDDGVTMGLFCYPMLMAADILMFNADVVPVGKDQIQHIEMTRDIAGRFNSTYAKIFTLPEAQVDEETQLIPGLDGRKMSKSYDNTLPLFCDSDQLYKLIKQIDTDSKQPGEPKEAECSTVFQLYNCFADRQQAQQMRDKYAQGIGWGEAKKELFEFLDAHLSTPRDEYNRLMNDLGYVESVLLKGAQKAREKAVPLMEQVRIAVGIRPLPFVPAEQNKKAKKEKSADDIARAIEGKRRGILMQLKASIEAVANSADSKATAQKLVADKTATLSTLKGKAKEKSENELLILKEELALYL